MALFDKMRAKRAAGQGIFGKQGGFGSGQGAISGIGRGWQGRQRPESARRGEFGSGRGWLSRIGKGGLGFMGQFGKGEGNLARLFNPGKWEDRGGDEVYSDTLEGDLLPFDMQLDEDKWSNWRRIYEDMLAGKNQNVYSSVLGGGKLSGGSNPYASPDLTNKTSTSTNNPLAQAWGNDGGIFTEDNLGYDPYLK